MVRLFQLTNVERKPYNQRNTRQRVTVMTRGFITIATGSDLYFTFAQNLLNSYRLRCDEPYPFAILCDRENEVTALFDDVVLFEKTSRAFFDKFELLKTAPYDETIFIDADCLAYGNLNDYWDYFKDASDFSASGTNFPLDSASGLFQIGEIGEYRERVTCKPLIHGGLYFIRKGPTCDAVYADCQKIIKNYDQFRWPDYCAPYADEPVLCLAMAANGCRATEAEPRNYGIPWQAVTTLKCDFFTGTCSYDTEWHPVVQGGRMIHWSTRYCKKPLYRFEAEKLNLLVKYGIRPGRDAIRLSPAETVMYKWKLRYYGMLVWEFAGRAVRKLGRILKIVK